MMRFHNISTRAMTPLAERSEGKGVAATFMAPGWGRPRLEYPSPRRDESRGYAFISFC
jgi:hypothetical protein